MSAQEQWIRWNPVENLQPGHYIDSICRNENGLKIVLIAYKNQQESTTVLFEAGVYAYRETHETYMHARMLEVCRNQGRDLLYGTVFFKVLNSQYIAWISEQSGGISDAQPLEHFVIFTEDSMVEILANYEPEVYFTDVLAIP